MLRLCRVNLERSDQIFEGIERYREEAIKRLNPHQIILFGSFARGDINEGSDVDLIVVADWKEDFLDRIKTLMEINRFGLPLEPIGYTEDEFQKLIQNRNPFILEVLDKGKVIYQR